MTLTLCAKVNIDGFQTSHGDEKPNVKLSFNDDSFVNKSVHVPVLYGSFKRL
jgi:hypothetical protein